MKNRLLLCAVGLTIWGAPALGLAASLAHPAPAAKPATVALHFRVAPADEYFGHQKISILGINNTIHDTNLRIGFDHVHAAKYYGTLAAAHEALFDWARKYPQDTWLPGRAYYMSHVFWQMHSADGDTAADRCRGLLFKQFPSSHWAMLAKKETRDLVAPLTPEELAARNAAGTTTAATGAASTAGAAAMPEAVAHPAVGVPAVPALVSQPVKPKTKR
ncbi:MAG: hypothetical protein M3Z37_00285 [Candidatus Eremiobacteraeota bacterium]|nr:hypothetical protein [Candidatus Eremiobacteraeota bacterium]